MTFFILWSCKYTVSISGLEPDSPQPKPWQSKIVAGNKVHRLYSQWLFYSAMAGGCLVQDQISILYYNRNIYIAHILPIAPPVMAAMTMNDISSFTFYKNIRKIITDMSNLLNLNLPSWTFFCGTSNSQSRKCEVGPHPDSWSLIQYEHLIFLQLLIHLYHFLFLPTYCPFYNKVLNAEWNKQIVRYSWRLFAMSNDCWKNWRISYLKYLVLYDNVIHLLNYWWI